MNNKKRLNLEKLANLLKHVSPQEFFSILGGTGFDGYCVFEYYKYLSTNGFDRNPDLSFDENFYYSAFTQHHKNLNNDVIPSNLIPNGTGSIAGPTGDQVGSFNVTFFDTINIEGNDGSTGSSGSSGSIIGDSLSSILSDSNNKVMINSGGHAWDLQSITAAPTDGSSGSSSTSYNISLYDPKTGNYDFKTVTAAELIGNVEAFKKPGSN
ncbi:hypothetical protein [Sphingobacterium bovisgrunnientis]|uniref:hypothetical protein n=1 Tax=Sphingobacterium bovisgrunnientis TaxID=1874697 RepID=UPI00135CDEBA|nr:hypothetical protein [Sphingobacterium bovisgrunnientis]